MSFRIGIIGGMGPMAGVLLQKIVIEATPAQKDQDHIQVVCFTNPQIPDRTSSLQNDNGVSFAKELIKSGELLLGAGVDVIAIPCNTAHTKIRYLEEHLPVPIVNMVSICVSSIKSEFPEARQIGVLATDGTIETKLYQDELATNGLKAILPDPTKQRTIMEIIYGIKAGKKYKIDELQKIIDSLAARQADMVILACTELSLGYEKLSQNPLKIIDPLRILGKHLVNIQPRKLS